MEYYILLLKINKKHLSYTIYIVSLTNEPKKEFKTNQYARRKT